MRRTSLPAALPGQNRQQTQHPPVAPSTPPSLNQQELQMNGMQPLLVECHGIITDMLLDPHLPCHLLYGLNAIANLLSPPPPPTVNLNVPKPRPAPLTLSVDPEYTSDIDDIPFTGEKVSSIPKIPVTTKRGSTGNFSRRMSTSTWTTTTSATGMPTLEPQPISRRRKSATFRSNIEGTPGNSPTHPMSSSSLLPISIDKECSRNSSAAPSSSTPLLHSTLQASHKARSFSANALYASSAEGEEDENDGGEVEEIDDDLPTQPHVTFKVQEPIEDEDLSLKDEDQESHIITALDGERFNLLDIATNKLLCRLSEWDYPIFDLDLLLPTQILSNMCYKIFLDVGLFETFKIPIREFINYFHALELGYRDKPYHNRMHAADVLHGVYYFTSQPIPGFEMVSCEPETPVTAMLQKRGEGAGRPLNDDDEGYAERLLFRPDTSDRLFYGIMGANLPALELMALYTAAAMHDYDHPGRTNAFLVSINAPQALLYNDRSVLENHHAAAGWALLLSTDDSNFLKHLDKAEFKRFRYLVIEAILATDLKRHFEILTEFNSKVNEADAVGIDWNVEADRLLVMEMMIKLSDINGPCKFFDIHVQWTHRIAEEFYEQGDEEVELGLPISPYMDRNNPQLARLQESFINHLVAPLCKACAEAGLLPGYYDDEEEEEDEDEEEETTTETEEVSYSQSQETDFEPESLTSDDNVPIVFVKKKVMKRRVVCLQTKHLQDNHRHWMTVIKEENRRLAEGPSTVKTESIAISTDDTMETIEEENTPSFNRSFSFEKEDSKL